MPSARLILTTIVSLSCLTAQAAATKKAVAKSPEQAVQSLYAAWQKGDRRAAKTVATGKAVDKLFGINRQVLKFDGCEKSDEGGWQCVYADADHDFSIGFGVDGGASVGFYNVTSVSFSTEAI